MLVQATQKIEVIVRKEDGASEVGVSETPVEQTGSGAKEGENNGWLAKLTGSTSKRRQYRVIKTNLTHAWAVGRQGAGLLIQYSLGGIGYQNGDSAYQDAWERQVEVYKDTTSVASSFAMGALYGSWGGPLGAVIGAVLNAASTVSSLAVKYMTRGREYSVKLFKEYNGIQYQRARASINLTTGRLR